LPRRARRVTTVDAHDQGVPAMDDAVRYLNPEGAVAPLGRYSHAAVVSGGKLAFIAGQVAVDAAGEPIAPGDLEGQIPAVFDNIAKVLAGLGIGFRDVVEFTSYICGDDARAGWYRGRDAVYARLFPDGAYPPNTLLIISGLARPEFRCEISAVARVPG
jgi:enamine deaminase RidA (YjgF/YER057c/UK114 family)